jgi:hypothetical protein
MKGTDAGRRDRMARLPERRRNAVFRVLSRVAGALALVLILSGFILDAADVGGRVEPVTLLLMGIYMLGVQIYFLLEYFVETGGIE